MKLTFYILMVFLLKCVFMDQCPSGTTNNILKSIKFEDTNPNSSSTYLRMFDVEHDSDIDDYFYSGDINNSQEVHFISRYNYLGDIRWSRVYSNFIHHNTLKYSPTNQMLLYTIFSDPLALIKIDSFNGDILGSYQLSGFTNDQWYHNRCSLSRDESAFYCNLVKSQTERGIIRFDVGSSQINKVTISDAQYKGYSIVAINRFEILYSYKIESSDLHHIVKASYNQSSNALNEDYHQTISGESRYCAVSRLGDNDETVWHAANIGGFIVYFQYNLTGYALIGNKYIISQPSYDDGLDMEVAEGIVCILTNRFQKSMLLVNATTQEVIKTYVFNTPERAFNLFIKNGYLSIIGCKDDAGTYCSHDQIPTSFGYDALPSLNTNLSFSASVTSGYALSDTTLTNNSMDTLTNLNLSLSSYDFTLSTLSTESYALSLRDSLNHNITVNPGQTKSLDLPCRVDDFSTQFTACDLSDTSAPSWITIDCDNSQIQIQDITQSDSISGFFSIKSTIHNDEVVSSLNITLVSCDYENCESCADGICDTCSAGYEWKNDSSSCEIEYSTVGPTYTATPETATVQTAAGASAGLGFLSAFFGNPSTQSIWSIVHVMQIILILPLIVKSMNYDVQNFIVSNAYAAFSVYLVPLKVIQSIPLIKDLSFDQPDEYLRILGWSSGSTLVNNLVLLMILFLLAIVHTLLCLLHYLTKNKEGMCNSIILKAYRFFTFSLYIRIFIELYLFTAVMFASEIKYYIKNSGDEDFGHQESGNEKQVKGNYASLIISCFIFVLLSLFMLLALYSWMRNKNNLSIPTDSKTREFYNNICKIPKSNLYQHAEKQENDEQQEDNDKSQENDEAEDSEKIAIVPLWIKIARLYAFLFLARRMIMAFFIVFIPNSLFALKMAFLFIMQVASVVYVVSIRSFTSKKDQICEALNETMIFVLLIIIANFKSKSDWTDAGINAFIVIILIQSITLSIISFITIIFQIHRFLKRRKLKFNTKNNQRDSNFEAVNRMEEDQQDDANQGENQNNEQRSLSSENEYQENDFEENKQSQSQNVYQLGIKAPQIEVTFKHDSNEAQNNSIS